MPTRPLPFMILAGPARMAAAPSVSAVRYGAVDNTPSRDIFCTTRTAITPGSLSAGSM
ncbi:hypothetical protein [Deinococcus koreensis]|uniref:hypothetical protein n=1 Tax=Deinococcus koreensis TaxID=2054903 RepID=UPI0013FD9254|nr:hypothetical protein [Deinococcus koreensis]